MVADVSSKTATASILPTNVDPLRTRTDENWHSSMQMTYVASTPSNHFPGYVSLPADPNFAWDDKHSMFVMDAIENVCLEIIYLEEYNLF